MNVIDTIFKALDDKGYTPADLARFLGKNQSVISTWKKRGSIPSVESILQICEFLDLDINELYGLNVKKSQLNENENNIINMYRKLSDKDQYRIEGMMELKLVEQEESTATENKEIVETEKIDKTIRSSINIHKPQQENCKEVSYLGDTAAGTAIEAIEGIYFDEKIEVKNPKADYVLTVRGDSMEPKIIDGQLLEVQATPQVDNGEIAVVKYDGNVTCKKIYTYADRIELHSINKKYSPIIIKLSEYDLENDTFKVLGRALV